MTKTIPIIRINVKESHHARNEITNPAGVLEIQESGYATVAGKNGSAWTVAPGSWEYDEAAMVQEAKKLEGRSITVQECINTLRSLIG